MGSHGGATAEGQVEVLRSLGVTEEYCGAPVRSSMDSRADRRATDRGVPAYLDRHAADADGVLLVNRIKTHTDFLKGEIESGLMKMSAIGLGKQTQALVLHRDGVRGRRRRDEGGRRGDAGERQDPGRRKCRERLRRDHRAHRGDSARRHPRAEAELLRWSKTMMPNCRSRTSTCSSSTRWAKTSAVRGSTPTSSGACGYRAS